MSINIIQSSGQFYKEPFLKDDLCVRLNIEAKAPPFMVNRKIRKSFYAENSGLHRISIHRSMMTSPVLWCELNYYSTHNILHESCPLVWWIYSINVVLCNPLHCRILLSSNPVVTVIWTLQTTSLVQCIDATLRGRGPAAYPWSWSNALIGSLWKSGLW